MVGKWHLCPTDEMNLASTRRNWPTGRGFERWYGFLGAETNQWYPDLVVRQPPGRPAEVARGRLPPHRRPHRQGDRVHQGRQGDRAGEAVLPVLRARRLPRAAPRARRSGSTSTRAVRHGLRGDARDDPGPAEGDGHRPGRHRAAADQPDRHAGDPHRPRRPAVPGARLPPGRGTPSRTTRSGCSRGWPRSTPGSWRTPTPRSAGCSTTSRRPAAREHHGHRRLRQRRQRRGRPERLGQRDEVRQRHPGRPRRPTSRCSTSSAARRPTTTTRTAGRWRSTRRSRCGSATSSTAARPTRASSRGRPGCSRAARSASSTTTRSTSCRRSSTPSASRRPETHQGAHPEPLRRRQHALTASTTPTAPSERQTQFYSMLGSRGDLARGLEGDHHPPDDRRLGPLQRRRVGAVPRRRRPLRAAQPGRRAARQAPRAGQPLVRRGRRERGVPARRPLRARDHDRPRARSSPRATRPLRLLPRHRAECPSAQAVNVRGRSFVIGALVDIPSPGAAGVLFAHGSRFGGHALYVKDNRLHYVNSFVGSVEQMVVGDRGHPDRREPDPVGLVREGRHGARPRRPACSRSTTATTRSARQRIKTQLGGFMPSPVERPVVGRHVGDPVTDDYPGEPPYTFTGGTINRVAIDVSGEAVHRPRARGRPDADARMSVPTARAAGRPARVLERHTDACGDRRLRRARHRRGRCALRPAGRPGRGLRQRRHALVREADAGGARLHPAPVHRDGRGGPRTSRPSAVEGRVGQGLRVARRRHHQALPRRRQRRESPDGRHPAGLRRHDRRGVHGAGGRVPPAGTAPEPGSPAARLRLPADGRAAALPGGQRVRHLHRVRRRPGLHATGDLRHLRHPTGTCHRQLHRASVPRGRSTAGPLSTRRRWTSSTTAR